MERLCSKDLIGEQLPEVVLVATEERTIDEVAGKIAARRAASLEVRIIRGRRCRSRDGLFQEWAAALQFPYYFGHNWDAFDECIGDLSWLTVARLLAFVTQADQILRDARNERPIFASILKHFGLDVDAPGLRWRRIVLQCDPERLEDLQWSFDKAGVRYSAYCL